MASSRTQRPADALAAIRERVADVLAEAAVAPGQCLLLGLSGGLDSIVLLHALAPLRERFSFRLQAHHVHHGLSPNADAWAAHCAQQCAVLEVPLAVTRVHVEPLGKEGWEAAARRLRHAAWMDAPADWWVTAHHRDDQAESVLFRLFRGAGVHGAAAMARVDAGHGRPGRLRPLLALSRAQLEQAARAAGLDWVEDESNAELRFSRNFLRHAVLPRIRERFAGVDQTLARAAGRFAEAAQLLDELAAQDAVVCGERPMARAALRALSPARQANLLRWQLGRMHLAMPDEARLHEALRQFNHCGLDHPLCLPLGAAVLHAYRDHAWLTPVLPAVPASPVRWAPETPQPWGEGRIVVREAVGQGVDAARIEQASACELRARWPGCRVALPGRPPKEVRKLAQACGWSPVARDRLPILCVDGVVAWMAGVGVAAGFECSPGAPGWVLAWERPAVYSASGETLL